MLFKKEKKKKACVWVCSGRREMRETKRDRVRHSKAPVTIERQKLKGP